MTYSTKHEWYKTQLMKNIVCSHFYIPATCYDDIFGEAPDRCLLGVDKDETGKST